MTAPSIVWLRRDLRLSDQPAFHAAAQAGPVIPVYVLDDEAAGERKLGGAARWWLHHSLEALDKDLRRLGSRLILRRGSAVAEIAGIAEETGAATVHALHHYEPWWRKAEDALAGKLDLCLHDGNYLLPPGSVATGAGTPFKIYTPFAKAAMRRLPDRHVLDAPKLSAPHAWPGADALSDWHLLPTAPDWAEGFAEQWSCGEDAALSTLDDFVDRTSHYEADRNNPSIEGTSRLSPHLHWGEISPAQVWQALDGKRGQGADTFRHELLWRDFAQGLIDQFPDYAERGYRAEFDHFDWRRSPGDLRAWQQGRTGYPIVDAGMRQLWSTGWMHNRVRMIVASFLVKHLLIDWREGERWFWNTLVDADYGNNGCNWQWVAGTGGDSNMFVRIMAPLTQSAKFDAGAYIREWVPELAGLRDSDIHDPGDARPEGYPPPIVDHRKARERALAAYRAMRTRAGTGS